MCDPILGQITIFAGNYAPRGWAFCDGQLLKINDYQSLYAILGTQFGGEGRTTFALPDLRGRVVIHAGMGPGLSDRYLGERGGQESVTMGRGVMSTSKGIFEAYGSAEREPSNMPPYVCVNFIIALEGIYPPRS